MNPTEPTKTEVTQPEPIAPAAPVEPKARRSKRKLALVLAVAVVVLGGGSAAAYYAVVVPNKPQNALKTSVQNLTKQEAFTAKGKVEISSDGTVMTANMNMLHIDTSKKVMIADMELTVSGVKIPVEVRFIDDNAYVKLGDLTTIKSLLNSYGGDMGSLVEDVDKKVSNQWVEIDKTLLNSASSSATQAKCTPEEVAMRTRAALNEAVTTGVDSEVYTIQKTSSDTVDGAKVRKLELAVDKSKLASLATKVKDLPAAKELEKCNDMSTEEATTTNDVTNLSTFNVWIDGSKHIKRVELKLSSTADSTTTAMGVDMTMVKDAPNVEKPADAKPFMQLVGELSKLYKDATGADITSLGDSLSL